jgi:hypothetical protein
VALVNIKLRVNERISKLENENKITVIKPIMNEDKANLKQNPRTKQDNNAHSNHFYST